MTVLNNLFLGIDKIADRPCNFSLYIFFQRLCLIFKFLFVKQVNLDINGVNLTITEDGDIILKAKGKYIDIDSDLIFICCDDDNKIGEAVYKLKGERNVKTLESRRPSYLPLQLRRETLRQWRNP